MKIKDGYVKTPSINGWVVVPVGKRSKEKRFIMELNGTANEIWDCIADGKTEDEIAEQFVRKYGITKEKALTGINRTVEMLKKENVIE